MAINQKMSSYRRDATLKKVEFLLNKEEFKEKLQGDCHYCGEKPKLWSPYISETGDPFSRYNGKVDKEYMISTKVPVNGVDRISSKKGYTIDNTVSCCWKCNMMKNTLSEKDFLEHIDKIFNFKKL